jgi:hypothetical protein
VYEKTEHLNEFEIKVLHELASPSLDETPFEKSPFRMHILVLQSIINAQRVQYKKLR